MSAGGDAGSRGHVEVRHLAAEPAPRGDRARTLAEGAGGAWRVALHPASPGTVLDPRDGTDRLLVWIDGAGADVLPANGARARLRGLEPYRCAGDAAVRIVASGAPAELLEVRVDRESLRADVAVLRLAGRRTRESLAAGDALVWVLRGAATARVTGEEAPYALAPGDRLSLGGLRGGEELELAGADRGAELLLVRLERARGRDGRGAMR